MTKLDTHPARCDLTSRECCKLLCGIAAGVVGTGVPIEALRRMFGILHLVARGGSTALDVDRMAGLIEGLDLNILQMIAVRCSMTLLGATMGAIAEQASVGALETALDWINEHEEVWETAFGTLTPPKGAES